MPGLHHDVLDSALSAGLPLTLGRSVPWLSARGHLDPVVVDRAPASVVAALAEIHLRLGGDAAVLRAKAPRPSPTPDLVHTELGCIVEVDEVQHFTTARLSSLDSYPVAVPLGFDADDYRAHIREWRSKGDAAFAHKLSKDFPNRGGRQAQRAYNDSLRDLLAPTFTGFPVIRIAAPGRSLNGVVRILETAFRQMDAELPR